MMGYVGGAILRLEGWPESLLYFTTAPTPLVHSCGPQMTWVPNELTEFDLVLFGFLNRVSCPKG